ncbi:hypothetical protein BBF96_05330 [Anoxybacter fermentans]|uniref:Uncharacterized protein n=1 Tax=Anoxybacter fermentans TaxID=1323375 RepID=A0A3Q9HPV6_9FIRM|nr:GldG family protein [Anoxybacter fermentans]AZR72861.1 hypothetical protein BBF96_05330 [Anoxybacter fermentans]
MNIKKLFTNQRFQYGGNAVVLVIAVVGIIILLNLFMARFNLRYDFTADQRFSLSPQTKEVLKNLDADVEILAFFQAGSYLEQQVKDLLKEYKTYSKYVDYQFIDPDKEPSLAKKYEIEMYNTLVVLKGDRSQKIKPYELYSYGSMYGGSTEFKGEQALTRAIMALTRKNTEKIYFLTGHEELSLDKDLQLLKSDLVGEGFEVDSLNLVEKGSIPEDASLLIMAGPKRDLETEEVKLINNYLASGGHLMAYVDPVTQGNKLINIKKLLADWGIELHDDLVIDPKRHYFFDALTLIPKIISHSITSEILENKMVVVIPYARSMDVKRSKDRKVTNLLVTSNEAWGETDFTSSKAQFDEGIDQKGPLTIGAVVTAPVSEETTAEDTEKEAKDNVTDQKKETRLVVFGTSSFLVDQTLTAQGNRDLVLNSVQWMVGQKEQLTIRPRTIEYRELVLDNKASKHLFYVTVVIIPLLVLSLGFGIWLRRRSL